LGDVIESEDAIYGDGVHIAAGIEALAEPGGVSISRTVFKHVRNKLPYVYEYQGEYQVKNISNPVNITAIRTTPLSLKTGRSYTSEDLCLWPIQRTATGSLKIFLSAFENKQHNFRVALIV
jgi:class 3 adenylate cyclase